LRGMTRVRNGRDWPSAPRRAALEDVTVMQKSVEHG